jgi:hypothetical protein
MMDSLPTHCSPSKENSTLLRVWNGGFGEEMGLLGLGRSGRDVAVGPGGSLGARVGGEGVLWDCWCR